MATLEEGQEYGLASNDLSRGNITVVHFKLTDSALKALEDFYKVKNGRDQRTTIQFKENQGIINISSHASPSGNRPQRSYKFSLSSLPEVNGSFDCVQQTNRQGFSSLQSLGSIQYKVAVHATDDVYDSTRAKMNLAEEESKKVCTKEIKPSGPHISKKVKKVLPSSAAFKLLANGNTSKPTHLVKPLPVHNSVRQQHHHPAAASASSSSSSSSSPSSSVSAFNSTGKSHYHHQHHHQQHHHPSPSASSSSLRTSTPSTSSPSSHSHGSRQSPTTLSSGSKPSPSSSVAGSQQGVLTSSSSKPSSSGAINMPYRDRVIHLLALKPYKKPELVLRLQKDGIRDKDRNSLGSVLQQVATMNKDNSYTLARSAWIDVRQDWPHYTDADRTLLKKNLQLDSRSIVTSPAVSPASSNPESPGSSQKRMAEEVDEPAPMPSKKKRISHMERQKVEERQVGAVKPIVTQQSSSPDSNRENQEGSMEADTDLADYCRTFVAIKDRVQRQQYKQEFNKEYGEYRNLHEQVEQVAHRFQGLLSKITATDEESDDFVILQKQAIQQFETQKADPKFMAKKRRMEYLHQKLGHIKRLIHEFDHQQPLSVNS